METILGIRCRDFVMLATDMSNTTSIMVMKTDEKKIYPVSDRIIMAVTGGEGDAHQFAEYIVKNMQLYKMRNGYELKPKPTSHFVRQNLADYLRSQTPYQVNLMLGGYDPDEGGQLFFMDYLAAYQEVPYGVHGYGGLMAVSILDRYCRPDMSIEEAYGVLEKCIAEVQKRLIINLPNFHVKVVGKDGVQELKNITSKDLASKGADL
ncbi:proteasome subunit beta type-2-like [Cimex lectularius]|uniref:Proteasome subunit beta n=1 Tax=Cimex lectularius TaxID=79782 RepID=A0A8I6RJR4_CIMLE|nr:proteasome subunit beta type-2-like [Cimex lectularius]